MQKESSRASVASEASVAAATALIGATHNLGVMRNLLNIIADGEGLTTDHRVSALALASLKYVDDIEDAVGSAARLL